MPRRTKSAPTPLGAYSLCPATESRSTPNSSTRTGSLPTAWAASVWTSAPLEWAISASVPDRHDGAGLIVGQHHAHQRGVPPQKGPNLLDSDPPIRIDRQAGELPPIVLQAIAGPSGRGMLHHGGHHVPSAFCRRLARTQNRQVVGLGSAGGEEHLLGLAAEKRGNLLSGLFDGLMGPPAVHMRAGRIAEVLFQPGQHGFHHLGLNRGGGVMVQVYGIVHIHLQNQYFSNITFPACHRRLGRCSFTDGRGSA